MFNILEIMPPVDPIKIVDVGAMSLGEGTEPYHQLMARKIAEIVGFEPIKAQCELLNAHAQSNYSYLPYFIGDGKPGKFNECNHPYTSSLYEPNSALLSKFQELEEVTRVVGTESVQTKRLDDIPDVSGADYLKVDVQGGELEVFAGAQELLKNVLVVHSEVEFIPMYKDQPLFAEVDQALRRSGFMFHKFHSLCGRTFNPIPYQNNMNVKVSQILWADAVYVKDFMAFDKIPSNQLIKLAVILHEVYESFDLAYHALEYYDRSLGTNLREAYAKRLSTPIPEGLAYILSNKLPQV